MLWSYENTFCVQRKLKTHFIQQFIFFRQFSMRIHYTTAHMCGAANAGSSVYGVSENSQILQNIF